MPREEWTADGYVLTQGTVRDVEMRDGLYRTAQPRGENSTIAARHGERWRSKRLTAGGFVLNLWLGGTDRAAWEREYDLLLRAVTPLHRLVRYVRTLADGSQREALGEFVQSVEPVPLGQTGARMGIEVRIPSGTWADVADKSASTAAGAALPQRLVLTPFERSTGPMDGLRFTVDGPIQAPQVVVIDDGVERDRWTYNGTLTAGQTLTVDSGTWAVTGGGFTAAADALTWTGLRYATVPAARPGVTPTVELRGTGGGTATRLTVTGRGRYLA